MKYFLPSLQELMVQVLNETTLLYISLSTVTGLVVTAVTLWFRYKHTAGDSYVHSVFLASFFTVLAVLGVLGLVGYWVWWRVNIVKRRQLT